MIQPLPLSADSIVALVEIIYYYYIEHSTMSKKSKTQDLDVAPLKRTAPGSKSYIQADWEQREWIEGVNTNLKKVVEFLNKFGALYCR